MNKKKIYTLKQIEGACIIGSPIVAVLLIFHNYKTFGQLYKGILWIFIGILWTLGFIEMAMLIPESIVDSFQFVIPPINGLILYPIIKKLQGEKIKEHFECDGEKGSNGILAALIVLVVAMYLALVIWVDRNAPIENCRRQSFHENGIYYNVDMPLVEVNKLGGILERIEYFSSESPSEVLCIATDTTYEFKLIADKEYFNDNANLTGFKEIFKHIERYDFKLPFTFMITDPDLRDNRVVELGNCDSISMLLESVVFEQNQNFRLIYDISIDKEERDKFQKAILSMGKLLPPQNRIDFLMDYEEQTYLLKLFVPRQKGNNWQFVHEAGMIKRKLNNFGFEHPFRLILLDNTTTQVEEYEIE